MEEFEIDVYETPNGKRPFETWLKKLDREIRKTVLNRIDRLAIGNFGDCKYLKNVMGVCELRINRGPGYRIYFGKKGHRLVILLTAGDKQTQRGYIVKAKKYWLDYLGGNDGT